MKLFIPFFLIISTLASANTYYVSTTGNNSNPGTLSQPWATWQKAFSTAVAGDTVYFRGGTYYITTGVYSTAKGTRQNPICYFNYPGEVPILDGIRRTAPNEGLMFSAAEFIYLKGLTIRNNRQIQTNFTDAQGVYFTNCKNVHVDNCKTYNNGMTGFKIQNVDTAYFYNCDTWNNCDSLNTNYPGGKGDGFFIYNSLASNATSYVYYKGCRSWHNSDDGFDTYSEGRVVVENCWSFSNGYLSGDGAGFKFGFKYLSTPEQPLDRRFVKCLAANNKFIGFTANNNGLPCINTEVYNCTSFGNAFGSFWTYSSCTNPKVSTWKNNLAFSSGNMSTTGMTVNTNNSWNTPPGPTVTNSDFLSTDISLLDDDRQADGSLPDISLLKLASGSDLIDAGTNIGLPFNSSAPDLGYTESGSGTTAPVYINSSVENAAASILVMNYNLSLANIVPAASAFTVSVNSVARTVSSVAVSGTKVSLTLSSPIVYGNTVTVAYTKPATNPLQTTSGGQAVTIAAQTVTNNVGAVAPVYQSSSVENAAPTILVMNYNLSLANILPSASAFTVLVSSVARTVNSVAISGTKVSLTLSSPVVFGNTVTVAYTKPATNPLQTTSGGQAITIAAQTVTNNVGAVAPVYQSSSVENAAPSILVMNYNISLANIIPAASAFTVSVNSVARTVSSVAISGTKVSLTLSGPVVNGNIVTVTYTKPATNPLQTASGGQAITITAQTVLNNVAAVPVPVYTSSSIENTTPARIEMTYNSVLANIVPAVSAYSATVNALSRSISSVAVSGTKVLVTLSAPVVFGDLVKISYVKPATNPLQTTAGGQAVSISAQSVVNNVAAVVPLFVNASVENAAPSVLVINYNLSLANILPAASAFTVIVNSVARTVNSVTISGTKVSITLSSQVVYGNTITVAYTKPATNPLQTVSGGQVASMTAQTAVNNVASIPVPVYTGSSIENTTPARIEMTYNLTLANIVPASSAFSVMVNSVIRTISTIAVSGTKVFVTLSGPVVQGDVITVSYTRPSTSPLQTTGGGQAVSIAPQPVTNNVLTVAPVAPVYVSSSIENSTPSLLEITYSQTLANVSSAPAVFTVMVNSVIRTVNSVSVSGTKVQLTLSNPVVYGDLVSVSYTKPATNPIQNTSGGQAGTIGNQNVTNHIASPVENPGSQIISIYPNPNDGHFTVDFLVPFRNPKTDIRIYDLAGHQVYRESISSETLSKEFNLTGLRSGVYILIIVNRRIVTTQKFVIN